MKKRNILNDYNFAKDIGAKCAFIFTMMPFEILNFKGNKYIL
jgi:hypothetical protein